MFSRRAVTNSVFSAVCLLTAFYAEASTAHAGPCSDAYAAQRAGGVADGDSRDLTRWTRSRGTPTITGGRTSRSSLIARRREFPNYASHRFSPVDRLGVALCFQRRGPGRQAVVRLGRNRISLLIDKDQRVLLRLGRRVIRAKGVRGRKGSAWQQLHVRLDRPRRRVYVRMHGKTFTLRSRLTREGTVLIGELDRRSSGSFAFDKVSISPAKPDGPAATSRLFARDSVWNAPLPRDAPIDSDSAVMTRALAAKAREESKLGIGPWIATDASSTPIYEVPGDQPTVRVALDDPTPQWRRSLQAAFERVPIPPNAKPAVGTDGHLTVWQPGTDKLWEFWQARKDSRGAWRAAFGGAIEHVSRNPGYYNKQAWPGAESYWGASATSLPVVAGTMTLKELRRGRIDHALAVALPAPRSGVFALPAQRTDGRGGSGRAAIPEGAQLRLDPDLDLSKIYMPPMTRLIAEAAQRYGMVVRDQTGHAIGFYGEDPRPTGTSPYFGPTGFFKGKWPAVFLSHFPWDDLQVIRMKLRHDPE